MTDGNKLESALSRRTFSKGAVASGAAVLGIAGFGGSAAAQQDVRQLQLGDVELAGDVIEVDVRNVNVLQNVNVQDVVVTVIGDNADVDLVQVSEVDVTLDEVLNFEEEVIEIQESLLEDIDVTALNNVSVSVTVLGGSFDPVAQGFTTDSL